MSTLRFAFVCAAALAVGCAGSSGSSKTEEPLRREDTAVAQIQMRVKAVDQKKRLVTVVDASGGEATFEADPAVKNFPQIRVGDDLIGTLAESLVLELREPTAAGIAAGPTVVEALAAAAPGP